MVKERKDDPRPPADQDFDPEERPTVVPDFDPAELAKATQASASSKPGAPPLAPSQSPASEPAPETTQMPESLRSSLLSLADSQVPSVRPPGLSYRPPAVPQFAVSPIDKGWADLSPDEPAAPQYPSEGSFRRATSRLRAPSEGKIAAAAAAAAAGELDEHDVPTREHLIVPNEPPGRHQTSPYISTGTVSSASRLAVAAAVPLPSEPPGATGGLNEMRHRFSLGDYSGALALAEALLADSPEHAEAKDTAEKCRHVLKQMYTARLGPLDRVPTVAVARDQLRWLSLDHRAGFLLSHVDGVSSLEMILDVCGMPQLDALRILCELAAQKIISLR